VPSPFLTRGLIGPSRQFGPNSIYNPQLYAIIAGAILPFPFWFLQRRHPDSWAKFVSTPVVLLGVSYIPPATGINYSSWFAVGFVFQYIIRKRNFAWWSKYNYVTGAALDCGPYFVSPPRRPFDPLCEPVAKSTFGWRTGTVLSLITIFFLLQLPKGGFNVNWWGNSVFLKSASLRCFSGSVDLAQPLLPHRRRYRKHAAALNSER
jgi:OPT oligopeptide transporter protein